MNEKTILDLVDRVLNIVETKGWREFLNTDPSNKESEKFNSSRMTEAESVLTRLCQSCHDNAVKHGFWDGSRHPAEVIALIHSELSELLEAFRMEAPPFNGLNVKSQKQELGGMLLVHEELADIAIRVFDMAGRFIGPNNFANAILKKMIYNTTRENKHGKSF